MIYLKVSNPGVAPFEGFLLLGASTTGHAGVANTTGQFGSGSKHFVRLCLINDITPIIFLGTLKLEFYFKPVKVNDGLTEREFRQICCRVTGKDRDGKVLNRTVETSMTDEFGRRDWTELAKGLREVVSNALDRAAREAANAGKASDDLSYIDDVKIEIVDNESKVRAKAGETRVYIQYTPEVSRFHAELPKRFLHFSDRTLLSQRILPKAGRELNPDKKTAVIYREGVFVRQVENPDVESLFDYNFAADQIQIDESRNLDDYSVAHAAAKLLNDASVPVLATAIRTQLDGAKTWETENFSFSDGYFDSEEVKAKRRNRWGKAWEAAAGEGAVVCTEKAMADLVTAKGRRGKVVNNTAWKRALERNGAVTDVSVLSDTDLRKMEVTETTPIVQKVVDDVWSLLELVDLVNGKEKPPVKGFVSLCDGSAQTFGYYSPTEKFIAIHKDYGDAVTPGLVKVVVEELAHHITGSSDCTRDFQDYAFRAFTAVALKSGLI